MDDMVWMRIQLFQKITSFKLSTTLTPLTEFVSFINFTLFPKLCPKKQRIVPHSVAMLLFWDRVSPSPPPRPHHAHTHSVLRGQPARTTAFHLEELFNINLESGPTKLFRAFRVFRALEAPLKGQISRRHCGKKASWWTGFCRDQRKQLGGQTCS